MIFLVVGGILYLMRPSTGQKTVFSLDDIFKKYAGVYGLDWLMLKSICANESSLGTHPSVVRGLNYPYDVEGSKSSDGKSWGLMQVTLPTAQDFDKTATAIKLNDPEYSVKIAAQFLAWLTIRYKTTDPRRNEWIVKSYNQGAGNTNKEINGQISGYAKEYWERYQRNYKKFSA